MSLYTILSILIVSLIEFHNVHITYSKVALENKDVTIRTSFYIDDFELALSQYHGKELKSLSHNGSTDSLLRPYLSTYFKVIVEGDTLQPSIISSGTEADMCFYIVAYHSNHVIKTLTLSNSLLFKEFSDQKNLLSVTHLDTEETWSFYCIPGESTYSLTME